MVGKQRIQSSGIFVVFPTFVAISTFLNWQYYCYGIVTAQVKPERWLNGFLEGLDGCALHGLPGKAPEGRPKLQ
jgi:hypothetical protein